MDLPAKVNVLGPPHVQDAVNVTMQELERSKDKLQQRLERVFLTPRVLLDTALEA